MPEPPLPERCGEFPVSPPPQLESPEPVKALPPFPRQLPELRLVRVLEEELPQMRRNRRVVGLLRILVVPRRLRSDVQRRRRREPDP